MTASVKPLLELKKRLLTPKQLTQNNFALGQSGEERARNFLIGLNYRILDLNIRVQNNEVDLVAFDQSAQEVVFVEVKTRRSSEFGHPSLAVNHKKITSMNKVARVYLATSHLAYDYRFDIITVSPTGVEHFENVSW